VLNVRVIVCSVCFLKVNEGLYAHAKVFKTPHFQNSATNLLISVGVQSAVLLYKFTAQVSPAHLAQRPAAWQQVGDIGEVWTRANDAIPHTLSDEMHPRLRQTARCATAFFILCISISLFL
jgi:hypothetical protein